MICRSLKIGFGVKEEFSFLKKRNKKLLPFGAVHEWRKARDEVGHSSKSFLVLFFQKRKFLL
jgi:hypothetical protein